MTGRSLTSDVPGSIGITTGLLTGRKLIPDTRTEGDADVVWFDLHSHVKDVCRAHIFLAEKESAPKAKLVISSKKLTKEGFSFKYEIEEIYDEDADRTYMTMLERACQILIDQLVGVSISDTIGGQIHEGPLMQVVTITTPEKLMVQTSRVHGHDKVSSDPNPQRDAS